MVHEPFRVVLQVENQDNIVTFCLKLREGILVGVSQPLRELLKDLGFFRGRRGARQYNSYTMANEEERKNRKNVFHQDKQGGHFTDAGMREEVAVINYPVVKPGLSGSSPDLLDYETRLAICAKCEYAELDESLTLVQLCKKCGCAIAAKAFFESLHCPIGKW